MVAVGGLVCLCDLRGSGYVAYWLLIAAAAAVGAIMGALGGVIGQLMNVLALSFARSAKFVLDKPASDRGVRAANLFDGGVLMLR
ncbi:MAG: hypothetical protein WBF93_19235 [Pirellulales bacterium]